MIDPQISEGTLSTTDRMLRQFAGLWVLVLGSLACWAWLARGRLTLALAFAGIGLLVGLLGLLRPQAIRPLFGGLMALTFPIGWVVSHLLLALLFFGLFTPVAILFRLIGRDELARHRCPDRASHWLPKPMPNDIRSYFRQS